MMSMSSAMFASGSTKRYDIPLSHLDHTYIDKCTDVKELEKILRILRSGEEGCYPDLERLAETKLSDLAPNSRTLRKPEPASRLSDLDTSVRSSLQEDIGRWNQEMKNREEGLMTSGSEVTSDNPDLPPIRSGVMKSSESQKPTENEKKNKPVKPREFREWDKFNVDKELEKVEVTEEKRDRERMQNGGLNLEDQVSTEGLTEEEKLMKANREKDKGNEAFRSGDFDESVLYYSRSISLLPTTASFNNRALAYLKQEAWENSLSDLQEVLTAEPDNIKGLLRRGTAYKGKKEYTNAASDFLRVLELEPTNKRAEDLLIEVKAEVKKVVKEKVDRKVKGRRMMIEEVDGSDDEQSPEQNGDNKQMNGDVLNGEEKLDECSEKCQSDKKVERDEKDVRKEEETRNEKNKNIENGDATDKPERTCAVDKRDITSDCVDIQGKVREEAQQKDGNKETVNKEGSGAQNKEEATDEMETQQKGDKKETTASDGSEAHNPELRAKAVAAATEEAEDVDAAVEEEDDKHQRPVFYMTPLPADVSQLRQEGNTLFKTGQYADALVKYQDAINVLDQREQGNEVSLSQLYSNQAACKLKTGDCSSAIADCTTALDLLPHAVKPLLRRASAFEMKEKYRKAYVDYKHVLSIDSNVQQAHQGASRCQKHLKDLEGSKWRENLPPMTTVFPWEIPTIVDPSASETLTSSGTSQAQPRPQSASKSLSAEVKKENRPSTTSEVKSPVLEQSSGGSKASTASDIGSESSMAKVSGKSSESAVCTEPETEQQRFDRCKAKGNEHVKQSEFQQAAECYTECIEALPDVTAAYTNRALCYLKLNKASEAVIDCNEALRLEEENTKALYRRAQGKKMLAQYKESLADLLQLLKIEPNNTAAKKEVEVVKQYYKKEFEKTRKEQSKDAPPKHRRKMKIEEVDDEEETVKGKPASSPVNHPKTPSQQTTTSPSSQHVKTAPQATSPLNHPSKTTPNSKKSKKSKSKTKATAGTGLPTVSPSVPKLEKATPYEFLQAWNSLKTSTSVDPFTDLVLQVKPEELPNLISNKLDGHMLHKMIACVKQIVTGGDLERGYSVLSYLCKVDRFSMVQMFMSAEERKDINHLCDAMSRHKTTAYTEQDVAKLKKVYGA